MKTRKAEAVIAAIGDELPRDRRYGQMLAADGGRIMSWRSTSWMDSSSAKHHQ